MREREDQEAREAGHPGGFLRKGGLRVNGGGRAATNPARPPTLPRYRLKRSIQPLASGGDLYLLRSGRGGDFVISSPSPSERAAVELLAVEPHDQLSLTAALKRLDVSESRAGTILATLRELEVIEEYREHSLLSSEELERYDRQLIYFEDLAGADVGSDVLQRRLTAATVGILGCGGLGSWVAAALACAGIGRLVLVDDDRVELSNLNRQILYRESDIGRPKVEAAVESLLERNSRLEVEPIVRRVRGPGDLSFVSGLSLLISTADWPPYELHRWLNDACMTSLTPYLTAGQFLPHVRVGPLVVPGMTACNECVERHATANYPVYEEISTADPNRVPPAATLGAASGVVGSLLAMEAIHHLTAIISPATTNASIAIDLVSLDVALEPVASDAACTACREARAKLYGGEIAAPDAGRPILHRV